MKAIDFRPAWYVSSLAERRSARLRTLGITVICILLLGSAFEWTGRTSAASSAVESLQVSLDAQAAVDARIQTLEEQEAALKRQADLLAEADGGVKVNHVLAELSHLMPRTLSLRTLALRRTLRIQRAEAKDKREEKQADPQATKGVNQLDMVGWASSGAEIATFVRRLADSELFDNVTLRFQRPETYLDQPIVEFQVLCTMPEFE